MHGKLYNAYEREKPSKTWLSIYSMGWDALIPWTCYPKYVVSMNKMAILAQVRICMASQFLFFSWSLLCWPRESAQLWLVLLSIKKMRVRGQEPIGRHHVFISALTTLIKNSTTSGLFPSFFIFVSWAVRFLLSFDTSFQPKICREWVDQRG